MKIFAGTKKCETKLLGKPFPLEMGNHSQSVGKTVFWWRLKGYTVGWGYISPRIGEPFLVANDVEKASLLDKEVFPSSYNSFNTRSHYLPTLGKVHFQDSPPTITKRLLILGIHVEKGGVQCNNFHVIFTEEFCF